MTTSISEDSIFRTNFKFAMTVVTIIVSLVVWGITLQQSVSNNTIQIENIEKDAKEASDLTTESRLKLIEIQTQLKSIDETLTDIKDNQSRTL